ncbi:TonB-dependent receptor [bacterium]|nr:TonB-dependent receptor [bacterium]
MLRLVFLFTLFSMHVFGSSLYEVLLFKDGYPQNDFKVDLDSARKSSDQLYSVYFDPAGVGQKKVKIDWNKKTFEFEVDILSGHYLRHFIFYDSIEDRFRVEVFSPPQLRVSQAGVADSKEQGRLSGRITSFESGRSIANAKVYIQGREEALVTDEEGLFEGSLVAGKVNLYVLHADYSFQSVPEVDIRPGFETPVLVKLSPKAIDMGEVLVAAPKLKGSLEALLDERRGNNQVSDSIGAEQFSKSGDSNAASALRRVTGLSLVGGKFIYVRGLGERYSSTLLNGAGLPSPDPRRRVVPLDLFPTSIVESISIQKSYSPDLPGEFGGGSIQVRTKGLPDAFQFEAGVSANGVVGDVVDEVDRHKGGKWDFLGFDDGSRQLPDTVDEAISGNRELRENNSVYDKGFSGEDLEKLGEAFSSNYGTQKKVLPPGAGMSVNGGTSFRSKNIKAGFLSSLGYENSWDKIKRRRIDYTVGSDGELTETNDYTYNGSDNEIDLNASLSTGIELYRKHKVDAFAFITRKTQNTTELREGYTQDIDSQTRQTMLTWEEREMKGVQVKGANTFSYLNNLTLNWRYMVAVANREEPDKREYRYDLENDEWVFSTRTDGNQRIWSELRDRNDDFGVDVTLPILWSSWFSSTFKTGTAFTNRNRSSVLRRFSFVDRRTNVDPSLTRNPLEDILQPENIAPDGFQIQESTRATDSYSADQRLDALYGMLELNFTDRFSLMGGLRYEESEQEVLTYELFNPDNAPTRASLITRHGLPASALSWNFVGDFFLRASASRTLSRPDFRELSTAASTDDENDIETVGNSQLKATIIDNYDARVEWFFARRQLISFGVFYKEFEKPIEVVFKPSTEVVMSYENAQEAKNLGIEFELRKDFAFLGYWGRSFAFSGNYSYIFSEITLDPSSVGVQTNEKRPLQGQSPYLINATFEYESPSQAYTAAFVYNVFGKRIARVGVLGAPDSYERPFHQLDFVSGLKLSKRSLIKFKLKNLLNQRVKIVQGEETTYESRSGLEVSMGYSLKF